MQQLSFKKYPEVTFKHSSKNNLLEISAPWMTLEFETESEHQAKISEALRLLSDNSQNKLSNEDDQATCNWFLEFSSAFPISEILPRIGLPKSISSGTSSETLLSWLKDCPAEAADKIQPSGKVLSRLQTDWTWDAESVLAKSKTADGNYDPLSLYTCIQGLRLRRQSMPSPQHQWFPQLEELRQNNEQAFFELVKLSLRQTYHVTSCCLQSLAPAVSVFVEAAQEISDYIQDEKGHDKLVMRSLKALGVANIADLPLFQETEMSMHTLQFAAEKAPMAFACLIGIFEATNYSDKDSLAEILERSSCPEAAEGIQIHFEINRDHDHASIGQSLASKLGSVSYDQALAAVRLAELTVTFAEQVMERLCGRLQQVNQVG